MRSKLLCTMTGLCLLLSGCSHLVLAQFERRAARQEYDWIVRQSIHCNRRATVCARLHFLKASAFSHTAVKQPNPKQSYRHAANELENGLARIPAGFDPAEHQQALESLCRALVHLFERQSDAAAKQTLSHLSDASRQLSQLAPGSVPATYYLACVPLCTAHILLPEIAPTDRPVLCSRLKRHLNTVLATRQQAGFTSPAGWDRYADKFERLSFDLGTTLLAVGCHQGNDAGILSPF